MKQKEGRRKILVVLRKKRKRSEEIGGMDGIYREIMGAVRNWGNVWEGTIC